MDYTVQIAVLVLILYNRPRAYAEERKDFYGDTANVFSAVFHKYNENIRPYKDNLLPVCVQIDMSFAKIGDFNKEKMELETVTDLRVRWEDNRLYWYSSNIKYITVNSTRIWTPDVGFLNTFSIPEVLVDPRFLVVGTKGLVTWHKRIKIKTHCTQLDNVTIECPLIVGSPQFSINEQQFCNVECTAHGAIFSPNLNVTNITSSVEYTNMTGIPFPSPEISLAQCMVTLFDTPEEVVEEEEEEEEPPESLVKPIPNVSCKSVSNVFVIFYGIMIFQLFII